VIKKAIVLAAGKGTRLMPLTLAVPKEMIRVGIKPVIEHAIEVLKAGGIEDILIIVGRKKEAIMDYLGSGERLDFTKAEKRMLPSFYIQSKILEGLG